MRRALASVDLAAIEHNCQLLRASLTGAAKLCAVVKADGYGHGAIDSARAALAGGASWLAVATAEEAARLRAAGLRTVPILVMGALTESELALALEARADIVVSSCEFVTMLTQVKRAEPVRIHVKLDTGMGRLGIRGCERALRIVEQVQAAIGLDLAGVMTHFATGELADDFFQQQLNEFTNFVAKVKKVYPKVIAHAANSGATLNSQAAHFDLVRCGIAIYGMDPANRDPLSLGLKPALELKSYVAAVKACAKGESSGYGRRFIAAGDTILATIPIGYGDGVRRGLTNNCEVLINGQRYPTVGAVSMDNVVVELGVGAGVQVGDTVTLLGQDGGQRVLAEEWAQRLETINYEVTCGISARVPRQFVR